MGLAKFTAVDPYNPSATEQELDELIPKIHGVTDWTVHENGDVALKYDKHLIGDDVIEEALAGMGFKLVHILDDPDASEVDVKRALDE